MAYLVPDALQGDHLDGRESELQTLALLRKQLSSAYTVFHSVHWTNAWRETPLFGEADFIVVNAEGSALVVEQKRGALEEGRTGLGKRYGGTLKSVPSQIHRTLDGLRDKFKRQSGHALQLDYLLFCPDHRVQNLAAAGLDTERIVDARDAGRLPERIAALLPEGAPHPMADRIRRFLEQSLDLVPDIHASLSAHERHYARASGGLAESVGNISGRPLRLAVRGTAGCGKSLVAVKAYRDAVAAGKRPLLLCFNRDLKEKMKAAGGPGGVVETWYGAIAEVLKSTGRPLDHATQVDWDKAVEDVLDGDVPDEWRFDVLIVDEGQDFDPGWSDMIDLFAGAESDRLWLDDPDQTIRQGVVPSKEGFPLSGWTGYRTKCNYRSPRSVARYIKDLLPKFEFDAANPLPGAGVGVTRMSDKSATAGAVGTVAAELLGRGYKQENIIVLSLRGLKAATLGATASCGNQILRRPTGTYDLFGNQLWTPGKLRFDTIRRYKGQQDAAVILTDVDIPEDPERVEEWERLMFASLTRATDRVEIVASGATADHLAGV
jgi:hypothetical protein